MCFMKYKTQIKSFVKCTMFWLLKVWIKLFKRILRVTLYEILWISVSLLAIFFVWSWMYRETKLSNNLENPVIMWWTSGFPGTSDTINCRDNLKCDVVSRNADTNIANTKAYLFYASNINFDELPLPRRPYEILWGLYHEESPRNVEELLHEKTLSLFNYSATFSRYSDIPFALQYLESLDDITSTKYFVSISDKTDLLKEISPIMYLQSDCETATERDAYVKELMKLIEIDSFGSCLNNKEMPENFTKDYLNHLNNHEFLNYVARYKFVLALENGVCDDYVTEKFWRAIKVGTVPIYFGSPTIKDWLPNNKSAILLEEFPSPAQMADHLKRLIKDENLYQEYLTHKTKKEITNKLLIEEFRSRNYQKDALEVAAKFECLICEKLHENQDVNKEKIVDKKHYNCPKPVSALTLKVNPTNAWVFSWEQAQQKAEHIYQRVVNYE